MHYIVLIIGLIANLLTLSTYDPSQNLMHFVLLIFILCVLTLIGFFWRRIFAFGSLFFKGNMKGLYSDIELNKEIKKNIEESEEVKIKVTRGSGLFLKENSAFYEKLFCPDNRGNGTKFTILLHYPCLESEIIKKRAEYYRTGVMASMTVKDYAEKVFDVIEKCDSIYNNKDNKNTVSITFYEDIDIDWRYYIFIKDGIPTTLFCHSDKQKKGPDMPMIKVKYKINNLCDHFNTTFDRIKNNNESKLILDTTRLHPKMDEPQLMCDHPACKDFFLHHYNKRIKGRNNNE